MVEFAAKPLLKEPFPDPAEYWDCPKSGLTVPKHTAKNLEWRQKITERAEKDEGFRKHLYAACAISPLFWFNAFAFTYHQFDVLDDGTKKPSDNPHVPFITWPVQDQLIEAIFQAFEQGEDLGVDKSRDMGATWVIIGCLHHLWLFRSETQILEMSRTRTYVDQTGNMKALFQKHDYLNQWLPNWMRPIEALPGRKGRTSGCRLFMHIKNPWNGAAIDGEATTQFAGSGDRRSIIMMDEFAKVQNGGAMRAATADVTPCRIVNSTPVAGTEYCNWIDSGQIRKFTLPWWEHPQKGKGRYVHFDDVTGKYYIKSPWYDLESARRSKQEMATEIDMDHIGAGQSFFDLTQLEEYRTLVCRPADHHMDITFVPGVANDQVGKLIRSNDLTKISVKPVKDHKRFWSYWGALKDDRPPQNRDYIFAMDISKGMSASNSVIVVYDKDTGTKVAEYANATVPPHEFARVAVASAMWFGGINPRRLPFFIWEANGDPGIEFGRMVVQVLKYPYFFRDEHYGSAYTPRKKDRYGWHSSIAKKAELLGAYRQALEHGEIVNRSAAAVEEAKLYITYNTGHVGPASLQAESVTARAVHGDRVIGDALANKLLKRKKQVGTKSDKAPVGSIGHRFREYKRKKRSSASTKFHPRWNQKVSYPNYA